jgi:hypothetical protein
MGWIQDFKTPLLKFWDKFRIGYLPEPATLRVMVQAMSISLVCKNPITEINR